MPRRVLVLLALLLLVATACRRRARRHRPGAAATAASIAWSVRPRADAPLRVEGQRYLAGALRVEGAAVSPPPYPASPLVASARVGDGWLFASEDGTVYRAPSFLGRLAVVAALPAPAADVHGPAPRTFARAVHGNGGLLVVDAARRAHAVDATGAARALDLTRVIAGAFASPRDIVAVTEPGVLQVSRNGGAAFQVIPVPAGTATGVALRDGVVTVTTTRGRYRWSDGALAPAPDAAPLAAWLDPPPEVERAALDHASGVHVLPRDPAHAAARAGGTVAVATGDAVVTLDPRTRREVSRTTAPGSACALHPSGAGLRAVCTHEGWARAVFAEAPGGRWTLLRDEARAEPLGDVAFDDASAAWIVHAPCAQRTLVDPRALCLYTATGERRDVRTPFDGVPVAMHAGVALVVEVALSGDRTRAALVGERGVEPLELPVRGPAARAGRWVGGALSFWDTDDTGRLSLVRSSNGGRAWRRALAPPGATAAVPAPRGVEYVVGRAADALWRTTDGRRFAPLAPPVLGSPAALSLGEGAEPYCVGPWCRLGGALELSSAGGPRALAIARAGALPSRPARPARRPHEVRCAHGPAAPGPDVDRGVAAPGQSMSWSVQGNAVTVRWAGAVEATVTGTLPPPPRDVRPVFGRAVVWAREPAGLLGRCAYSTCEYFLATRGGVRPIEAVGEDFSAEVVTREGGFAVRGVGRVDGTPVVTLTTYDAAGTPGAARTYALASPPEDAHAGALEARDGLYIAEADGALAFHPLAGDAAAGRVAGPSVETPTCRAGMPPARGVVRVTAGVPEVRGDGWHTEPGEWQLEAELRVVGNLTCLRAMGGGEARDEAEAEAAGAREREPVRSYELAAGDDGVLTGAAWGRERRFPLRCVVADDDAR